MKPYSPRRTRLVKSYAPIKNSLTEFLGIDKVESAPLKIKCSYSGKFFDADEFYVKKDRQLDDPRTFNQKDFRHIAKEFWDQKVRNQRNGLGWKTDEEVLNSPTDLSNFIEGKNNE